MGKPTRTFRYFNNSILNSSKLKVLDLYCCSGLAAEGMLRNDVIVVGVDIKHPSYYPGHLLMADVLELPIDFVRMFDFVAASPPCQAFSIASAVPLSKGYSYPNLIPATRELLIESGVPGYIENVPQAPIRNDLMLCGSMFNLNVRRHRVFELVNWFCLTSPQLCNHPSKGGVIDTVAGSFKGSIHKVAESMGCYPTRLRDEIKEGIPPAYSDYILKHFIAQQPTAKLHSVFPLSFSFVK